MSKTVMIVEDNELNMKLFNDLLESRGYRVIQTRNGLEALDLARSTPPNSAVSIIGGAEVFALLLPHTTRIEVTEVHADVAGDTFVPPFGPEWREVAREDYAAEGDTPAYSFVSLEHAA